VKSVLRYGNTNVDRQVGHHIIAFRLRDF